MRIGGIIHELTHRPLAVEGQQHALGATAGLAFYDPVTGQPGDEVLARADQSLVQGKRLEKGRRNSRGVQGWGGRAQSLALATSRRLGLPASQPSL